ncbi:hypothetical protein PIROE2DRAFT_35519, partial [Piromyces sp. E2]
LIEQGADVNDKSQDGSTPLHLASQHNRLEVVKCLLSHQAEVDALSKCLCTPLCNAIITKAYPIVQYFVVECGVNTNVQNLYGWTPLMLAVCKGSFSIVKLLVDYGSQINCCNHEGWSPMTLA